MTVIAHISDLHLLEERLDRRDRIGRWRLGLLSVGRALDPARRRASALAALRLARAADQVVVTGDLTEDGSAAQFELLAEVLHESGVDPQRVTLVPGNHDAYGERAFEAALAGPLRPFASSSEGSVERGAAIIVPVSTAVPQHFLRSGGRIEATVVDRIAALARRARRRALVVAQHHPPHRHGHAAWRFIDGLRGQAALMGLLEQYPHMHLVHGHIHRARDRRLNLTREPQVFAAPACGEDGAVVRLYDVADARIVPRPRERRAAG